MPVQIPGLSMDYSTFSQWAGDYEQKILAWVSEGRVHEYTKGWPLTDLESALTIAGAYLLFVLVGSMLFKVEAVPAIKLYPVQFLYNIVQVMLCSYMAIEAGMVAFRQGYTCLPCEPFNAKNPPVAEVLYIFYLSKILDFMDTFFIIIGKKWKQLSFLHVYHHTSIFLFYWLNINVGYDGDVYLTIVLNGFIHTVMYTYYFVSLHTKDIWWKSSLTMCQMIQFVTMNAQAGYLLLTGCKSYPPRIVLSYLVYILSLLVLFANFFVQSYLKKGGKGKKGGKSKAH
uniref:Elongation of fatty acids protein n=1 Tax=Fibrocapsa japonica TaxID=94617 RepID=A0A6U1Q8V8_9STRA|mmetsp:Transcript_7609/g.11574  ORF Transcript_7609/g.11574 Transcript_7609/m.11574 type:complete len:284 (+) Transcript_7609:115-966(+)